MTSQTSEDIGTFIQQTVYTVGFLASDKMKGFLSSSSSTLFLTGRAIESMRSVSRTICLTYIKTRKPPCMATPRDTSLAHLKRLNK